DSSLWIAPASDFGKASRISGSRERSDGSMGIAWTNDGRIVYGSGARGSSQIWVADADGLNARQLSNIRGAATLPAIPAAGDFVVFQQFSDKGIHIARMALNGSDVKQLTTGG